MSKGFIFVGAFGFIVLGMYLSLGLSMFLDAQYSDKEYRCEWVSK